MNVTLKHIEPKDKDILFNILEKYLYEFSQYDGGKFGNNGVFGYFVNAVHLEFWQLLALYISSNTLSSVPWAIPFGEEEIEIMLNQAKDVLDWYDNMNNPLPTWYKKFVNSQSKFHSRRKWHLD